MQSSLNPSHHPVTDVNLDGDAGVHDSAAHLCVDNYVNAPAAPAAFHGAFAGRMEMAATAQDVAAYLDVHQDWFYRCAKPMTVETICENGYALVIGKFGAFGYEVEPKIGLHLLPQDQGIYRIQTIEIPDYTPPGYDVDFRAQLELREETVTDATGAAQAVTQVEWELDLTVELSLPGFLRALPQGLLQSTGDRLLNQIVRQVSRRLTRKVQEDFHSTRDLPLPASAKHRTSWCR